MTKLSLLIMEKQPIDNYQKILKACYFFFSVQFFFCVKRYFLKLVKSKEQLLKMVYLNVINSCKDLFCELFWSRFAWIYIAIGKPNDNICTEKKMNKIFLLALHPDSLLQLDVVISVSKVLRRLIFATFAKPLKNSKIDPRKNLYPINSNY